MIDHPRFGRIRSLGLLKDVGKDEELFCDYGFTDNKIQTDKALETIINLTRLVSNKDDVEVANEIKGQIKYVREKLYEYLPIIKAVGDAAKIFF